MADGLPHPGFSADIDVPCPAKVAWLCPAIYKDILDAWFGDPRLAVYRGA